MIEKKRFKQWEKADEQQFKKRWLITFIDESGSYIMCFVRWSNNDLFEMKPNTTRFYAV